ncbi:hypothetical protein FEM48_Zijuj08G0203400 [Ziziphus jujuba var. spinosa]|uniref:Uncharacterized protein n=1 Tax=Ziziphus jujuba var. spinosa TaxID=714518 RepID=A0A978V167_ZIZJJ|nr:hypothetical protein FEM48_Zijuj08G0203400 [Ziziphus jujuba var. spinosa]
MKKSCSPTNKRKKSFRYGDAEQQVGRYCCQYMDRMQRWRVRTPSASTRRRSSPVKATTNLPLTLFRSSKTLERTLGFSPAFSTRPSLSKIVLLRCRRSSWVDRGLYTWPVLSNALWVISSCGLWWPE